MVFSRGIEKPCGASAIVSSVAPAVAKVAIHPLILRGQLEQCMYAQADNFVFVFHQRMTASQQAHRAPRRVLFFAPEHRVKLI